MPYNFLMFVTSLQGTEERQALIVNLHMLYCQCNGMNIYIPIEHCISLLFVSDAELWFVHHVDLAALTHAVGTALSPAISSLPWILQKSLAEVNIKPGNGPEGSNWHIKKNALG